MSWLAARWPVAALWTAAAVTRTESVLPPAGLPDSEFGNRTRGRLLPFGARQRRADQRPVHGTFVFVTCGRLALVFAARGVVFGRRVKRRRVRLRRDDAFGAGRLRQLVHDFLRGLLVLARSVRRDLIVRDAFRGAGENLRRERGRRVVLLSLPRDF